MPELKFTGPATLTGFPADKPFSFDIETTRLIIRAGKDVFATIERAAQPTAVDAMQLLNSVALGDQAQKIYTGFDTLKVPETHVLTEAKPIDVETDAEPEVPINKGPSYTGTPHSLILIDPSRKVKYRTIRAKYFETLQTANGREVGWWLNTSMVKALEGDPLKMLQFFINDGAVRIDHRGASGEGDLPEVYRGAAAKSGAHVGGAPSFANQQNQQPTWTPPAGAVTGFPDPTAGANAPGPAWVPPAGFGKLA